MRFSGAVLLWAAFTLIGMRMSLLLKKRQTLLEESLTFLNSLIVSIEYSRQDIVKFILSISESGSAENLPLIRICAKELSCGTEFPEAWRKAVEATHLYKRDEKTKMLQLGAFLGTSDSESQINTIKVYTSFFEKYLFAATEDFNKYGKASSLFGMFFGAAIFILLF